MNRVLKTILLWLLITVLPVQGIAAVMKASCGPAHHTAMPIVLVADNHHHDEHATYNHHHEDAGAHAIAEGSSDSSVTADKASGTYKSSYCSACAACCVGAVAPPPVLVLPSVYSSSEFVLVSPVPLVTGYIPDGLKRPPRFISA